VTILLVEDSAIERKAIGCYLREWGLDYLEVDNGAEAWNLLQGPDAPWFCWIGYCREWMASNFAGGSARWEPMAPMSTL